MDGLYELAETKLSVRIGEQDWQLSALRADDWAAITLEIIKGRRKPTEIMAGMLKEIKEDADRKSLIELVYKDETRGEMVSMQEVMAWVQTKVGDLFATWLMLVRNHPNITKDQSAIIANAKWEQLGSRVQLLYGYPVGNSQSPVQAGVARNGQSSPGVISSAA